MKILPNKINKFFDSILSKLSVPKKDRNLLIKSLLDSSIRGVDSHTKIGKSGKTDSKEEAD